MDPNFYFPQAPVDCDFTDIIQAFFCGFGLLDVQPQTGTGWTVAKDAQGNRIIVHSTDPTTQPGVFIEGEYTELVFSAKVIDPESTAQQSNVLLVSASYVLPGSTTEVSLVLFDDGSTVDCSVRPSVAGCCSVKVVVLESE